MDLLGPVFAPYTFVELFHAAEKHCSLAKLTVWGALSEKEETEADWFKSKSTSGGH